jgi:type III secretion protein V
MNSIATRGGLGTAAARYADIALALLAVTIIVLMVLPLPSWVLDFLVAVNIASGILMLLFAMYVPSPLGFSTFPTVLLFTTLFRIAINVATTRQILLHAHAGDIIDAFGRIVVGGSVIVGLVVFLIITVVQFVVIAKGAERVAEVGARFVLDAMPGKQMSIDSDMRAGVITQAEALKQRGELIQESQFYGAMDGAMKFVKGDSIAGILIVVVNLLGGIAIGALVMDMPLGEAVSKYSVLSIGDGLVSQIPALFAAMAAGVVVTRKGPEKGSTSLAADIGAQIATQPRALMVGGIVFALFSLMPGFPAWVFLLLGGAASAAGYMLSSRSMRRDQADRGMQLNAASREGVSAVVRIGIPNTPVRSHSPFRLQLHRSLLERIGAPALDRALEGARLEMVRGQGLVFPGIGVEIDSALPEGAFRVLVQGLPYVTASIPANAVLVRGVPARLVAAGLQAVDVPAPGPLLPGGWVVGPTEAQRVAAGLEMLAPADVVARVIVRTMQANATEALGVQEVRQMLRAIESEYGDLVREALSVMPLPRLSDMMAALARERVPLADVPVILQAVVTLGPGASDSNSLYQGIRLALARGMLARLVEGDGRVAVLALDRPTEERLLAAVEVRPDGPWLALAPQAAESLLNELERAAQQRAEGPLARALMVPSSVRRAMSRLSRTRLPDLAVLSYEELAASGVQHQLLALVAVAFDAQPSASV